MHYDFVVVGSGTAGSVVASRLSEDPSVSIALIEAGTDYPDVDLMPEQIRYARGTVQNPIRLYALTEEGDSAAENPPRSHDWNFDARANATVRNMPLPRGMVVGGTGAVNGGQFVRGMPSDFGAWVAAGNTEWSYEKVLPFYRRLENDHDIHNEFHGQDGPMPVHHIHRDVWDESDQAFEAACIREGYPICDDWNGPDATGVGPTPTYSLDGTRISTAIAYLAPARGRANLTIVANALVRRLLFRGNRAVGVEVEEDQGIRRIDGGEIIVCAGPAKSPQLLMLSGVGSSRDLEGHGISVVSDLPGVGRNLRDHPNVPIVWQRNFDIPLATPASRPYPTPGVYLQYTADGSDLSNDCRILWMPGLGIENTPGDGRFQVMFAGLYMALGKGEVSLRSADPHEAPIVDFHYLEVKEDRRRLRDCVYLAQKIAATEELREFLGPQLEPKATDLSSEASLDRWLDRNVRTSHHMSSTVKMGPDSDAESVVDQFGQVYGTEGLRVADASIMPDCVRQNTNATTIMIGERIADFIRSGT